jgi:hypothetical protein
MCRMSIDDDQPILVLRQDVDTVQVRDRLPERRRIARHNRSVASRICGGGNEVLVNR